MFPILSAHPGRRFLGNEAEDATVAYLEAEGYCIRHRNFTCRYGEIDVVAEKAQTVCFVEVRMRSRNDGHHPAHTVSRAKQQRVVKTALHYMFRYQLNDRMIRFDVMSVIGRGPAAETQYIANAFDAGM